MVVALHFVGQMAALEFALDLVDGALDIGIGGGRGRVAVQWVGGWVEFKTEYSFSDLLT